MSIRRFSREIGAICLAMASLCGCQGSAPPSAQKPDASTASSAIAGKSVADSASDKPLILDGHGSPDAVAQGAEDYARKMEAALARREANARNRAAAGNTPATTSADPASSPARPAPSQVQFIDPSGHAAADASAQAAAGPTTAPGSAAQYASIAATPPSVTQTPPRPDLPFNKDTPAVNTPLIVGQPRPLPATDDLARKFAQQVKDYPGDVSANLDYQLLQFLEGQSVPQMQAMTGLNSEDRELVTALLDGLSNFRNAVRADSNMLLSRKIHPLIELSDRLRTQAELTIPTVALCTDVKGFGVYEPLEPARFDAGQEHRVVVYCEVENFASMLDEQKRWQTKLTQDVVLYTEQNGLEVWRDKTPARPIVDYSRNRRHDFFIVKMIRLPANLTIGRYLLKVTVVDQQVNRVAENSIPIQVVAQN